MVDDFDDLAPISVDILFDGMRVDYGIYYYNDEAITLLCKDVILTSEMIRNLKKALVGNKNIYIEKQHRNEILEESRYLNSFQKKVESQIGYDKLKASASALINVIHSTSNIPRLTVNAVVETIIDKTDAVDISLLMQCLNGIREVDEYLYTHSANVGMLNGIIAKWLNLSAEDIKLATKVGLLHDIGKLRIAPEILNKPARLTAAEYETIKCHSQFGYEMVKRSGETNMVVLRGIQQHHERMNGGGYPDGLTANDITLLARITAISDVYDAMVARRVYKTSNSPFEIFEEFAQGRYSGLDIEIVNLFLKKMPLELQGKCVIMSDGSVGTVSYINPNSFKYPMVSVDGEIKITNKDFCCVSMYGET